MKHVRILSQAILVLCITWLYLPCVAQDKPSPEPGIGNLQVAVVGFQSTTGDVKIALSNSEANYTSKSEAFRGAVATIEGDKATAVFTNLPHGEYAVRVYHDANGNDKLDRNFMGIPKEPYGFSNNARSAFGPAKWGKAKFALRTEQMNIEIRVK